MISRIAVVPRGGLYMVNVLSRMLGLSGSEVLSLSISKYDREHPTQAGEFRVGSVPSREAVEGQVILLADEVHDTGETMQRAREILLDLGAASVRTAAIHYKPGPNTTGHGARLLRRRDRRLGALPLGDDRSRGHALPARARQPPPDLSRAHLAVARLSLARSD